MDIMEYCLRELSNILMQLVAEFKKNGKDVVRVIRGLGICVNERLSQTHSKVPYLCWSRLPKFNRT